MKISPLGQYRRPDYPTRSVVDDHPELLALVPKRWQANPVVLTVLTAASVMLSSCSYATDEIAKGTSKVAPIFKHGDGRASFGGDMSSLAVMLSEDDARHIIVEQAKSFGISFKDEKQTLENIRIPETYQLFLEELKPDKPEKATVKSTKLVLDGTDSIRNISFEFVSTDDIEKWRREKKESISATVSVYRTEETAKSLHESLITANPKGYYGIFYDPLSKVTAIKEQASHKTLEGFNYDKMMFDGINYISREDLRKQVKDFFSWLKAQGAI